MYICNIKNKKTINLYNIIFKHISDCYDSKIVVKKLKGRGYEALWRKVVENKRSEKEMKKKDSCRHICKDISGKSPPHTVSIPLPRAHQGWHGVSLLPGFHEAKYFPARPLFPTTSFHFLCLLFSSYCIEMDIPWTSELNCFLCTFSVTCSHLIL